MEISGNTISRQNLQAIQGAQLLGLHEKILIRPVTSTVRPYLYPMVETRDPRGYNVLLAAQLDHPSLPHWYLYKSDDQSVCQQFGSHVYSPAYGRV